MTSAKTDKIALNMSVAGEKSAPALVLAHPLGANLHVWDAIAPALSEKYRLIRFDARGHGQSAAPAGPYALSDLGGDVLAMLDDLGVTRAHFLGLSMGGALGQWLMIHAPRRLDKIVLANTASHFPDAGGWNARIRAARESGMKTLAPVLLQRWLTPEFSAARPDVARKIEQMLLASDPQGYAACCAALRDADLRDGIRAAAPLPALVIVGDFDGSTPPQRGAALAARLKDARLVRLPAAHLSCVEVEKAFVAAVLDFLDQPARSRSAARASPTAPTS